jgi:gamma-glutamyltranspeptidase/glutathione hydrolase
MSDAYAGKLASRIDQATATDRAVPISSDTTVRGRTGHNGCYIQSVFAAWGARFVIPGTGILMNNRLRGFSLDPSHPNSLQPGKRTVHTLNILVVKDGRLIVGGGTPGADFGADRPAVIAGVVDWDLIRAGHRLRAGRPLRGPPRAG